MDLTRTNMDKIKMSATVRMASLRVDMKVFREMRREQIIGVTGVIFLLAGYFVKIIFIL